MSPQSIAFTVWIVLAVIVVGTYLFFFRSTHHPLEGEDYYRAVGRLRKPLFIIMLVGLGLVFAFTVGNLPYATGSSLPDKVVYVGAKQFSFVLSSHPMERESDMEERAGEVIEIPQNATVEFRVRSFDVNHGFGIYGPGNRLIAQTQAMPGYVNRLIVRFPIEGSYSILCLEYCGLAHHGMRATFDVIPSSVSSTN